MSDTRNEGKIRLVSHCDSFCRVMFALPPLNIFGPANIPQLEEVVSSLESDDRVKVVVFCRAIDGFVVSLNDFVATPDESAKFPAGPTGLQALPDMVTRLTRPLVLSIASIRGRATGV